MRLTWATLILGTGVLAAAGMFTQPAKSDDTSAATFKQKCSTCHGPDGKAGTPAAKAMKVRSFADPDVVKMTDEQLAEIIDKGQGKMPKYGGTMKPDEIKAMVAHIRTLAK
jgi:cytochrome c6